MSDFLQVCETFTSIQGESTYAGTPCFFIRLTGCNLRCAYCDTTYAYSGGLSKKVAQLVREFRLSKAKLVEVTGGEPLLQRGTRALLKALAKARADATVLIETNGSQDISVIPPEVVTILDIKCPTSGASAQMDWRNLERLREHDEVKFVISNRADFEWAARLVRKYSLASKCLAVLFSPAFGRCQPAELARWLIASRLNARLNLQLHKLLSAR